MLTLARLTRLARPARLCIQVLTAASLMQGYAVFAAETLPQTQSQLRVEGPAVPAVVRDRSESQRAAFYDQFLRQTGFPDLSAEIEKTLSSPAAASLEKINKDTLTANWHRLQIVNFSRDLAVELLTKLTPTLGDEASAKKTAELASRLIAQKRISIPDAFPDAIRNIRNFDQRVAAKEHYLRAAIEKNIIRMQEQMLSDSLHAIYGREKIETILNGSDSEAKKSMSTYIKTLDGMIHRYVRALYFDHEMGLGHWIGEAIALGLVHTARISKDPEVKKFEALLNSRVFAHGEYLSDYVSDTLTFEDLDGKRRQIKVKHADTITEMYSIAWSSRMSAAGVRPHILNRWKAQRQNLIQDFAYAAVTADETSSAWQAIDGKAPSMVDKIRQSLAAREEGNVGASHAGMAYVYRNADSGVAITRAIDMYAFGPMPYGGARFIPTKAVFATPGVFANFGVASLNPEKTLKYLQELTKQKGFQPVFKVSDVYRPNEKGELVKAEGETFNWTPRITEAEQKALVNVDIRDAQKWHDSVLAPNLASEMLRYITQYGMAFRTFGQDPPNKMACYCTEGVNFAGFRETGHNLQSHPDQVHFLGQIVKLIPKFKNHKIFAENPIAPSFMAWDPKTDTDLVSYKLRGLVESWMEQMQAPRKDFDKRLTALISPMVNRQLKYTNAQGGQLTYSPESYINATEVTVVKKASEPHKTISEPRVNPMGISNAESPVLAYNPEPPNKAVALKADPADTRIQRQLHGTILIAAKYPHESEAAAMILSEVSSRLNDPNTMALFQTFTAKMMALKPINPPRMVPHELKALPSLQLHKALQSYIAEYTAQQIETQTRQILSDVTGILFGKDVVARVARHPTLADGPAIQAKIRELYKLIGKEVRSIYVSPEAADRRAFGMNLAIGLTTNIFRTQDPKNIQGFLEKFKAQGILWRDYFEFEMQQERLQKTLQASDYSLLKAHSNPGERTRARLLQSGGKQSARITEQLQLLYSPYAEAQPENTRSLDRMLNQAPKFSMMSFSKAEQDGLYERGITKYMALINKEQLGNNGSTKTSAFLLANPIAPQAPTYQRTCNGLFAM